MTPELSKLLQETSLKRVDDLKLWEVPQGVYDQAYEFLLNKYGGAMGRTNLMLNGHLITPTLSTAFKARAQVLLDQAAKAASIAKLTLEDKDG